MRGLGGKMTRAVAVLLVMILILPSCRFKTPEFYVNEMKSRVPDAAAFAADNKENLDILLTANDSIGGYKASIADGLCRIFDENTLIAESDIASSAYFTRQEKDAAAAVSGLLGDYGSIEISPTGVTIHLLVNDNKNAALYLCSCAKDFGGSVDAYCERVASDWYAIIYYLPLG